MGNPQWFCVRDGFLFYLFERTKCAEKKKTRQKCRGRGNGEATVKSRLDIGAGHLPFAWIIDNHLFSPTSQKKNRVHFK